MERLKRQKRKWADDGNDFWKHNKARWNFKHFSGEIIGPQQNTKEKQRIRTNIFAPSPRKHSSQLWCSLSKEFKKIPHMLLSEEML